MQSDSFFTWRACLTGLILSFLVVVMAHYSVDIVHGSSLAIDHMPAGGIFVFFILILLLNPILGSVKKTFQFSSHELILIYIMLLITSSITTMGLGAQLCPMIAAPFYYATPENKWAQIIQPYLKPWLVPQGQKVVQYFFEGLPKNEQIPWLAWIKPLSFWFIFIFALYMVMLCFAVILRKQWMEKERLSYPLVQLPREMIQDDERGRLIKPFFRNKLMWIGFAIPFFISSWNGLHHYFHFISPISLANSIGIFQRTIQFYFRISFPIMGFTYLISQEVAFSVWFFSLVYTMLQGIFNITGISSSEVTGIYGIAEPIFAHLGTGAFFSFVLFGLWRARAHLKEVFEKAFKNKPEVDDSEEIISYRTAVWGLILGSFILIIWLVASGMSILIALVFLICAFIFWIGLTRVIAEAGIPTVISPSIASSQVVSGLGSANIGSQGLTSLGLTYVYASDIRTFPMSSIAQGLKLSSEPAYRKRGIFWAILLTIVLTFIASNWIILKLSYTHGGMNLNSWYFVNGPQVPYTYVSTHINHSQGVNSLGWFCRISGAILMGIFMFMRYRFLWWPLHPLGFAIGQINWIQLLWFSIFLVWLIKVLILKYWGVRIFRIFRPLFLGFILGQYSAACLWFIIDLITGRIGNSVFWI